MSDVSAIPGLARLWAQTAGDEQICIAVIDGPVDRDHPALVGARLSRLPGIWPDEGLAGDKAAHGTAVASVIFGQHGTEVPGIAPRCRGISVPAFSGRRPTTSQLELARGIELAVEAGAHVINVSGGQFSASAEAEDVLARAVRLCQERNVLLVAAAGNDGCCCVHVPAALPAVLAVGALDNSGEPMAMSNWGPAYQRQGILAPGEDILAAVPGGGTARRTGTSLAAPVVTGVAGLLLSLQVRSGRAADPLAVREALLASADPCDLGDAVSCAPFLSGRLNIERAVSAVTSSPADAVVIPAAAPSAASSAAGQPCSCSAAPAPPPPCGCATGQQPATPPAALIPAASAGGFSVPGWPPVAPPYGAPAAPAYGAPVAPQYHMPGVAPSGDDAAAGGQPQPSAGPEWVPLVYAMGVLGYDFGSEARRDSFKQLMAPVEVDGTAVPANPYDARQMVDHLGANPSEARTLIWTLNLELTPVYAVEPAGPYAADVYALLARLLAGEVAGEDDDDFIERVAVPGRLPGRTVKLFSGQVVPVLELEQRRGLYGWEVNRLVAAAAEAAGGDGGADVVRPLREFLTRVYYDLRNLGATSRDRALNFAATNAFQAASTISSALASGMALDAIDVEKSPFGRIDSDCWDVKLRFFDPENSRRAKRVFRFTIDVSDILPVTLGDVRTWSET